MKRALVGQLVIGFSLFSATQSLRCPSCRSCPSRLSCPSRSPVGQQKTQTRLFPPQDLGLIEPADREQWQKPESDHGRAARSPTARPLPTSAPAGGWFTLQLARRVGPNGVVYAEDMQLADVRSIRRRAQREGFATSSTVLGTATDPRLPNGGLDAVLIVGRLS